MSSVDPNRVRALVRQALEEKLGLRPTGHPVAVSLSLRDDAGVKERFRLIPPQGASLETFAVHGD